MVGRPERLASADPVVRGATAMSKATLDRVLKLVKDLSPEEQVELQRNLDSLLSQRPERLTEDEFERRMIAAGRLGERKPATAGSRRDFTPIRTTGKPLSEVIIEERR